jgi:uncharacterized membrane protein
MSKPSRFPAVVALVVPVLGWLYVYLFQRRNDFAVFYLRQAVGLCLYLVAALVVWAVVAWVVAWVPYLAAVSVAIFTFVILAYLAGVIAWIVGLLNVLRNRQEPVPFVGRWASRLPIG